MVVALCGSLFVVSALDSDGTDLRPGRYTDLASLVQTESDAYQRLQREAAALRDEVDDLTRNVDDRGVQRKRRQAERLESPAGLTEVSGPGVTIVLSDAPIERLDAAFNAGDVDLNLLVVHQQDIQAVMNALWAGGADAMTIQGQRVVSTTGIKCTSSAVTLHGVPYPQPYVIQAIGDPTDLIRAVDADIDISGFREDAADPDLGIGWDLDVEEKIDAPAYEGLLDVIYAKPLPTTA